MKKTLFGDFEKSTGRVLWWPFWILFVPLVLLFMARWWGPGLPFSPRGESMPQLGYLWMLRRLWAGGGALSGWNPLVLGGEPTATARVYHLHLVLAGISCLLHVSPEWVLKLVQLGATVLAGLGMYLYMHRLKSSPGAALGAAVAFSLFPARIAMTVESLFVTCTWAGLPWVFWAYERTRDPAVDRLVAALIWGLALAWVALTGTQWLLLLAVPLVCYIMVRELCTCLGAEDRRQALFLTFKRLLFSTAIAGLSLVGVTLFYYLPSWIESEWLWSSRYIADYPTSARWPISPETLLRLLIGRWGTDRALFGWDLAVVFPNVSWYLGLWVSLLALAGLLRRRHWLRTWPLLSLLILSLLLVAGPRVPLNPAYYVVRRIPFVSYTVRNAFRYLWPVSFALVALAGLGLDGLLMSLGRRVGRSAAVLGALGALVLLLVDFGPMTQAYRTVPAYLDPDVRAAHEWLDTATGGARYWVPFQLERAGLDYTDTSYGVRYNGQASINDDEYHTPTAPYRASLLFGQALRGQVERPAGLSAAAQAILDLAQVRYLLLYLYPAAYEQAAERLVRSGGWRLVRRSETVAILENASVRPLVQVFGAALGSRTIEDDTLLAMLPDTLAKGYALVEWPLGTGGEALPEALLRDLQDLDPERLSTVEVPAVRWEVLHQESTRLHIAYQARAPFIMMVSRIWYPHWRVYVNGVEKPLLRLNGAFQGVYVEDLEGHVLLRYRQPWYIWFGYAISVTAAGAILGVLLKRWRGGLRRDA